MCFAAGVIHTVVCFVIPGPGRIKRFLDSVISQNSTFDTVGVCVHCINACIVPGWMSFHFMILLGMMVVGGGC